MKKICLSLLITSLVFLGSINTLSAQTSLDGYKGGLNISSPLVTGKYFDGDGTRTGPSVGVVVATPYGFELGPYTVGVGVGIESVNMGADDNFKYTGFYLSFSSAIYELASGPISVTGSIGTYGGLAVSGAIMCDYAIPGQPIVIQPYARTLLLLDANGNGDKSYLMSIGAMINYSL